MGDREAPNILGCSRGKIVQCASVNISLLQHIRCGENGALAGIELRNYHRRDRSCCKLIINFDGGQRNIANHLLQVLAATINPSDIAIRMNSACSNVCVRQIAREDNTRSIGFIRIEQT